MTFFSPIRIGVQPPDSPEARRISDEYYDDLVSRYRGRPATAAETLAAADPYPHELVAPRGTLLLARDGSGVIGCAGVRFLDGNVGEVTRVYVVAAGRGRGVGRQLMLEIERISRERGIRALRLDTRSDLVEARALYASLGYIEGAAHNADPYADHWFLKVL
jgi:GNAT superfamily N-acetyltransferase